MTTAPAAAAGPMLAYATPQPPRRPTLALVIGIIGIVYGSLGLLHGMLTLGGAVYFMYWVNQGMTFDNEFFWPITFTAGGIVLSMVLLPASIGVVRMIPRGRTWMLRWAVAYLAWQVVMASIQIFVVARAQLAQYATIAGPGAAPPPPTTIWMMYLMPLGGLVFSAVFPACVLVFLTREKVRAAFAAAAADGRTA